MQPRGEKTGAPYAQINIGDEFLNVEETAGFLKVKAETIYAWVHQRRIPFRKHGSRLVFSKRELQGWSEAQAVRPIKLNEVPPFDMNRSGRMKPTERKPARHCSLKTRAIAVCGPTSEKQEV
jgi:excisionase family DNA binding protein